MMNTWLKDLVLLFVGIAALLSIAFTPRPLHVPDEGRYSEIPREMIVQHDYLTPHLNEIKYFEKPPLLYWVQAFAIKTTGMSEWSLRWPTMLFAVLGCLMTYITGRLLFQRRTGVIASLLLATSLLYFSMAHLITTDMMLTFFLSTSLFLFLVGTRCPYPSRARRFTFWGAYACAGLGLLTKGIIALAFPMMIVGLWVLLLNDWRSLNTFYLPSGLLLMLLIALPWHVGVQQANPEFFHFYVIEQHFLRFATLYAQRYQPMWFFIPVVLLGFFPWTIFLPQTLKFHWPTSFKNLAQHKESLFLLLWSASILIVFSVSQSKLVPYVLPLFPPLALLTGNYLATHWRERSFSLSLSFITLILLSLALSSAMIHATAREIILEPLVTQRYLWTLAIVLVGGSFATAFIYWRSSLKQAVTSLLTVFVLFLIVFIATVPHVDARSTKPVALTLHTLLTPKDEVASLDTYYQDLPFYLQRRITVVNWQNELAFGMQHQDTHPWMIDHTTFWQRWDSKKRIYLLMDIDEFASLPTMRHRQFYPVMLTTDYVLFTNHPLKTTQAAL